MCILDNGLEKTVNVRGDLRQTSATRGHWCLMKRRNASSYVIVSALAAVAPRPTFRVSAAEREELGTKPEATHLINE